MATAVLKVDHDQFPRELSRTQDGYRGVAHYLVDTADPEEALLAGGLPRIGDPWSAQLPLVAVRGQHRVKVTRTHSWIRVDYESPRASLFDPGGQSHTELRVGTLVATVYQGALTNGQPDGRAIEGGAPREVGTLEAIVHTYYPQGATLPLPNWLALIGWLNSNNLSLPRVGFTGNQFAMAPDQVLYLGFEGPTQQGDRLVVSHRLRLSPSFAFIAATVDDADRVIESEARRIYGRAPFVGMW